MLVGRHHRGEHAQISGDATKSRRSGSRRFVDEAANNRCVSNGQGNVVTDSHQKAMSKAPTGLTDIRVARPVADTLRLRSELVVQCGKHIHFGALLGDRASCGVSLQLADSTCNGACPVRGEVVTRIGVQVDITKP